MSIFGGSKEKRELVLVFNIGSSSVGGSLFYTQKTGVPKIVFSVVESLPLEENITSEKLFTLTTETLLLVSKKIFSSKIGAPSKIFCVLSSPWYLSQTRIITLNKNTPFVFTNKLADSLLEKEIKIFQEENIKKYPGMGNAIRAIELKNVRTSLNGYETSEPIDKKAKEVEMTVFISMCEERVLKKIEDVVASCFHFNNIKFSSLAASLYAVVKDKYAKKDNFLLVDVGGEVTDISMIKRNTLKESISFPLGSSFLIRGVALGLKCPLDEARSMISLFRDGHAEKNIEKKISSILTQLKKEWLQKFQESLADLSHDISIPSTIFIATDKDFSEMFSEVIKTEQFTQYTLAESKFEVLPLDTKLLHGIASFEDGIAREPFLIIDSVYVNNFLIYPTLPGKI